MSVSDGQPVNAAVTNAAFMSRTQDTSTIGKVALNHAGSTSLSDAQKDINDIFSAVGIAGENDANAKVYSTNEVIVDTESYKQSIEKLDLEFHNSTGHGHSGAAGDGGPVSAANLTNFNKLWAVYQTLSLSPASGLSTDVTIYFSGDSPNGGAGSEGIITVAPNNLVHIVDASTQTFIEDAGGQRVYGRITESAGTWTLTYYTNEAGVETAHNLASTNIKAIYWKVFNQNTRPTIPSNPFEFGTMDVTADVLDASSSVRGVLNPSTNPQIIGGNKQWEGYQEYLHKIINSLDVDSATTGANATIPMVNAFGVKLTNASLTSVDLLSGGFATNNQFFAIYNSTGASITINHNIGAGGFLLPGGSNLIIKDNVSALFFYDTAESRWILISGSGDSFNLATFGSTPNSNGASYNPTTGAFNLQPADATNPGSLSAADQTLPSFIKKFSNMFGAGITTNSTLTGSDQELPNPANSVVRVTNSGLASIAMIEFPSFANTAYMLVLVNATPASIVIKNETGATANKRILTGSAGDLDLDTDGVLFLVYDYTSSRWRVVGGTGGGQTKLFGTRGSPRTIAAANGIDATASDMSTTAINQVVFVQGATAGVVEDITANPQIDAHTKIGAKMTIIGRNNTQPLKFDNGDGLELNGSITLHASECLELVWDGSVWVEVTRNV